MEKQDEKSRAKKTVKTTITKVYVDWFLNTCEAKSESTEIEADDERQEHRKISVFEARLAPKPLSEMLKDQPLITIETTISESHFYHSDKLLRTDVSFSQEHLTGSDAFDHWFPNGLSSSYVENILERQRNFNLVQPQWIRFALDEALKSDDQVTLIGPPGVGKTSFLASWILDDIMRCASKIEGIPPSVAAYHFCDALVWNERSVTTYSFVMSVARHFVERVPGFWNRLINNKRARMALVPKECKQDPPRAFSMLLDIFQECELKSNMYLLVDALDQVIVAEASQTDEEKKKDTRYPSARRNLLEMLTCFHIKESWPDKLKLVMTMRSMPLLQHYHNKIEWQDHWKEHLDFTKQVVNFKGMGPHGLMLDGFFNMASCTSSKEIHAVWRREFEKSFSRPDYHFQFHKDWKQSRLILSLLLSRPEKYPPKLDAVNLFLELALPHVRDAWERRIPHILSPFLKISDKKDVEFVHPSIREFLTSDDSKWYYVNREQGHRIRIALFVLYVVLAFYFFFILDFFMLCVFFSKAIGNRVLISGSMTDEEERNFTDMMATFLLQLDEKLGPFYLLHKNRGHFENLEAAIEWFKQDVRQSDMSIFAMKRLLQLAHIKEDIL